MQVHFYGMLRLVTGRKMVEFSIAENGTLHDLLHRITAQFPSLRDELLDEHGNLFPYIPLFINGRNPRLLEAGVNSPIQPQDVVSIFSPISSGRINVEQINRYPSG
jgi:sulfur-carrier protein